MHGGGWVWASVDTHDRLVRELAAAGGVATVSVDYSLAPEAKFPRAVLECAGVVRRLAAEAEAWGLDAGRLLLGGDLSGGNLALATALALRDAGGPKPAGLLTVYPVTEPDFDSPSYREFAEGYGLTTALMRAYWDVYLRDAADRANPLAAPARADLAGLPPTLILLAELDVLRSDGEKLAARLLASGVDCTLLTYPGVLHGFIRLTEAVTAARIAVADAGAWLRRVGEADASQCAALVCGVRQSKPKISRNRRSVSAAHPRKPFLPPRPRRGRFRPRNARLPTCRFRPRCDARRRALPPPGWR